jgi:V/A-type H+-transporting ATPase subunit K
MVVLGIVAAALPLVLLVTSPWAFAEPGRSAASAVPPEVTQWGFLAAAIAAGVSALGAAYAVAVVGAAAVASITEKPENAGRAIVFVGLAEGIAIYGLIIAIMILGRV